MPETETIPAPVAPATPAPAPTPRSPRTRFPQSRELTHLIAAGAQIIAAAQANTAIADVIRLHGYNAPTLADGLDLHQVAQAAFNGRQAAVGARAAAKLARDAAERAARRTFSDYRQLVQANVPGAAARTALGAKGTVSQRLEGFLTQARSALAAAAVEPSASLLAASGWGADRVTAFEAQLTTLATRETELTNATVTAEAATEVRNQAGAELAAWIIKFRRIAKVALRDQPALLDALSA